MRHSSFCRSYRCRCRGTSRPLRCESLEDRRLLTITVDTLVDEADGSIVDGDVSLRDAIAIAPAGETIDFDASLDGGTILLALGELSITKPMKIDASSLGHGLTIDALRNSRIFNVDDGDDGTDSPVTISGLTMTGGDADGHGGAIRTAEDLTVTCSTISGSTAYFNGDGIWASGDLTVTSSTISGNRGSGIWASGDLTVTSSTISGNTGSGISASGDLTVTSSTISGNTPGHFVGGGGGIWVNGAVTVTIEDSIVAGNVTRTRTTPDIRPGTGILTVRYSLIGDNQGTSLAETPVGVPDADGNLIGGPIHGVVDPMLAPMADNGGPTQTHGLAPGSPAIDAGDPGFSEGRTFDQRGVPFVRVFGAHVDMGPFERQPVTVPPIDLIVDTLADEMDTDFSAGDLSLREAVFIANFRVGADTITFDTSLSSGTIVLTRGELVIFDPLTIDAMGLADGLTIDASGKSRILNIDDGDDGNDSPVTIRGLTLTGGNEAAIRTAEDLTVTASTISGNTAGFGNGGGICALGNLTVTSSTISGNSAVFIGGGIWASGDVTVTSSTISRNRADYGGGIYASGDVTVTSSTVSENTGSGIWASGKVTVSSSTISRNETWHSGGGILASGNVTVTSSTISGNEIGWSGGGIRAYGDVIVTSSTVSGNSADNGGGISCWGDVTVTIQNSIVAGNTDNGIAPDIGSDTGPLTVRYSLIGNNTGTGLVEAPVGAPDANGNLVGGPINGIIDPLLGPLTSNGGETETHALLAGSPAIDAGDPSFVPPPIADQRGNPRVADGNTDGVARVDIGAFEVLRGDVNGDGEVNGLDVDPFVDVLLTGPPSATADMNADGRVNGLDVDSFLTTVVGGGNAVGVTSFGLPQEDFATEIERPGGASTSSTTERSSARLRRARHAHDGDDPPQLIQHRAVERGMDRRLRMSGDGHRSPQKDMVHEMASDWQATVDRAFGDGDDWIR
jgi:hypothetical protein